MRIAMTAVLTVLALGAAACVNSNSRPTTLHPKSTAGTTSASQQTKAVSIPTGTIDVPCIPVVTGGLGNDFLEESVRSGPIVFDRVLANRGHQADYDAVRPGKYAPTKTLVLLRKGRSALVVVPPPEQHAVSLLFQNSRLRPGLVASVAYGAPAVIFDNCPTTTASAWIEYPGAIILAGARCARLDVTPLKPGTHLPAGPRQRIKIPYGRKSCARHS